MRQVGEQLAQFRNDLGEVWRARSQLRAKRLRLTSPDASAQYLDPGPESWRPAGLPAAAGEHVCAPLAGTIRQLVGQAALADSRLSADQEQPPASRQRVLEGREQLAELTLASHERAHF